MLLDLVCWVRWLWHLIHIKGCTRIRACAKISTYQFTRIRSHQHSNSPVAVLCCHVLTQIYTWSVFHCAVLGKRKASCEHLAPWKRNVKSCLLNSMSIHDAHNFTASVIDLVNLTTYNKWCLLKNNTGDKGLNCYV